VRARPRACLLRSKLGGGYPRCASSTRSSRPECDNPTLILAVGDYGASMMAAGRKFCDVASQQCALVWSSNRVIRWFHPSPSFVNFIEPGASLGFDSLALAAHEGRTLTDEMEEVPAEAWIKSSWLKDDAVVSEQSILMPSYEGCLSLIWIRRPIEQKPTAEDELLPELDPEGFTVNRKRWPR